MHLPISILEKVDDTLNEEGSTYQEVVGAIRGSRTMSFCSAAEDMCSGEKEKLWKMSIRSVFLKHRQMVKNVAAEADTNDEMAECLAVAHIRDHLFPPLKQYIDTTRKFKFKECMETCEEWERSQQPGVVCLRDHRYSQGMLIARQQTSPYQAKKNLTCFGCGKMGHMAKNCRSKGLMRKL